MLPRAPTRPLDPAQPPAALHVKVCRYFLYGWLFRDATGGSSWERATALHHNREQSRWLPLYMMRWLVLGALMFGSGLVLETACASPRVSALFYVLATLTVPVNAVTVLCWMALRAGRTRSSGD